MTRFDLIIFDWDGTLADSAALIVCGMQGAIAALNLPSRSGEQIRDLIGLGLSDGMRRLYPDLDTPTLLELLAGYRSRFAGATPGEAPLFAGAIEALNQLSEAGHRLAVATGKSRKGLQRSLAHHRSVKELILASRTADETAPKPDPLMLRELLEELDCAPSRALLVGDTEYDAEMARAIGMPMLGVACGVHEPARLLRCGAMAVIERVAGVPRWIQRL